MYAASERYVDSQVGQQMEPMGVWVSTSSELLLLPDPVNTVVEDVAVVMGSGMTILEEEGREGENEVDEDDDVLVAPAGAEETCERREAAELIPALVNPVFGCRPLLPLDEVPRGRVWPPALRSDDEKETEAKDPPGVPSKGGSVGSGRGRRGQHVAVL